jgi:hypothetical protein
MHPSGWLGQKADVLIGGCHELAAEETVRLGSTVPTSERSGDAPLVVVVRERMHSLGKLI